MNVRHIMKLSPTTVRQDDGLPVAQALMAWMGIRHLPVLHQGRLTGILSERDLFAYRANEPDWKVARVRDAMTPRPQFAHPEDSLTEVAARMAAGRIGALPVVERGVLVGLITATDVLAGAVQAATAVQQEPPVHVREHGEDGALPALDAEDELTGVIPYVDVLRSLAV
jgi:acetoin utilization protein AcuB